MNTSPERPPDADPGLATERTRLAWTRTAVAVTALGAAVAKADPLIGLPTLGVTALVWLVCHRRLRTLAPHVSAWRFPLITGTIVGVSAAALVAVFLRHGGH